MKLNKCRTYNGAIKCADENITFWSEKAKESDYNNAVSAKEQLQYWKGVKEGMLILQDMLLKNPYAISEHVITRTI